MKAAPIYFQTSSGHMVDLLSPAPEDIFITDIASHLSMLCRFSGATRAFYSVSQHSVMVARMVPLHAKAHALLHDAHEAFLGDITSPVKSALVFLGDKSLAKLTAKIDRAIHAAFGLEYPAPREIQAVIQHADQVALATEKRDLLEYAEWNLPLPSPAKHRIRPLTWPLALDLFMKEYQNALEVTPSMVMAQERLRKTRFEKITNPKPERLKNV